MFVSLCRRLSSAISGVKQSPSPDIAKLVGGDAHADAAAGDQNAASNSPAATRSATVAPKSG